MIKLDDNVIKSFKVIKEFRENTEGVTSMDFFPDGKQLILGSEDETVEIYDCVDGTLKGIVNSKKYGVDLMQFTSDRDKIILTSTKLDHDMRCLSLSAKSFLRYYKGHTQKVTSLCSTPSKDKFLSCSLDKTLRVWDPRSSKCVVAMKFPYVPIASFEPVANTFAVGVNSEKIKLHDLRCIDRGPFLTFDKIPKTQNAWTDLKFSGDGKRLLINTSDFIQVIDAFSGNSFQTFSGHLNTTGVPLEASYTPDSKYILSGSTNGRVHIWNAENGDKVCVMNPNHLDAIQFVRFNPKFAMFVTTCSYKMAFWSLTGEDLELS